MASPGTPSPQQPPTRRNCGAVQSYFGTLDKFPKFRDNQGALEARTRDFMNRGEAALRTTLTTIPVVVHVVYKTQEENLSDEQIESQIVVLNADYQIRNADIDKVPDPFKPLIGNPLIAFELATADPNGSPTTGITRTATSKSSFSVDTEEMKFTATGGIDAWDTRRYLNIWVCTMVGGILGYAQFPGGPPDTDGVVILNTAFGNTGTARPPFNLGRTATHEVGHYLNLSHIWGESRVPSCSDSDFVTDTPNQYGPNGGKPTFPHVTCNNGPHGDMFMNYMDYVDDDTMFMFSKEQVARMHAALEFERSQLGIQSPGM